MTFRLVLASCLGFSLFTAGCDYAAPEGAASNAPDRSAENLPGITGAPAHASPARPATPQQPARPTGPMEPPSDPTVAEFLGLRGPKPATWLWHPPRNQMVHTNYTVPGTDGTKQAYVTVFYFPGEGGSVEDNIERWKNQFRTADGYEAKPTVTEFEVDEMPVVLVELAGEWMQMGAGWYTPDQLFLAAIIDAPIGRVFIRFAGPTATVEANREAFMAMLNGFERIAD